MRQFGPFFIDETNECLVERFGGEHKMVPLAPRPFALLKYLVNHAGRLIPPTELLDAIWPGQDVQQEVLKSKILEIRKALRDNPRHARYIETRSRRGYRFIGLGTADVKSRELVRARSVPPPLYGREHALKTLWAVLGQGVTDGTGIALVTGVGRRPFGAGKSAILETFAHQAASRFPWLTVLTGQCVESARDIEPFYPVLDAIGRFCQTAAGTEFLSELRNYAPTWLAQFPSLISSEDRVRLRDEISGATRDRMLREFLHALAKLTAQSPVLLVIDDVHWADPATLDLIGAIARQHPKLRLTLVVSYRASLPPNQSDPLSRLVGALVAHGLGTQVVLKPLSESDVTQYLAYRADGYAPPQSVVELVYRHCEGDPLVMVSVIEYLSKTGILCRGPIGWELMSASEEPSRFYIPEDIREFSNAQLSLLSPEIDRALGLASVMGTVFHPHLIADATGQTHEDCELLYEKLSESVGITHPIEESAPLSSALGPAYAFYHTINREVTYQRLSATEQTRFHGLIASALQRWISEMSEARPIADLAVRAAYHLELAKDVPSAIGCLQLAARSLCDAQYTFPEARATLFKALDLCRRGDARILQADELRTLSQIVDVDLMLLSSDLPQRLDELLSVARAGDDSVALIDALVRKGWFLSWTDSRSSIAYFEEALGLVSDVPDPSLRGLLAFKTRFWRMANSSWAVQECESGRSWLRLEFGHAEPSSKSMVVMEAAYFEYMGGRYGNAIEYCRDGLKLIDSHVNHTQVLLAKLLFLALAMNGDLAGAEECFQSYAVKLRRNENVQFMNSFESHHALLPLLCDYPIAAYDSCVNSLQRMKEAGYDNANHGRLCRIYMSCAESQLGNPEAARRSFNAILAEMEARPQLGNWYLRLVLDVYHSDALLKVGDVQQARKYCDEFLERVEKTEEWTYRALAYEVSARIALSAGDFGQAEKKITEALAIATNQWIPMARWKIHLTAAEISEATERVHETLLHLRAAAKGVKALIDPLPNGHSLKEGMLQSPAVRKAFLAAEVKNVA